MDANELAQAFSAKIREYLSADELQDVLERNAAEPRDGPFNVCHTHDFLDANQAMLDAMGTLGWHSYDGTTEMNDWINKAWDIAFDNQFGKEDAKR